MSGYWVLVLIISILGGLGGIISYWDPRVRFLNTGWFGHIFAGVAGAVLAVALGVAIFKIDVKVFGGLWELGTQMEALPEIIFIAALSVLGGYASLNLIPTLSNIALRRLQDEVAGVKAKVNENREITKKLSAEENYTKGRFVFKVENDLEGALFWFNEALRENPEHASSWSNKAMVLKRLERIGEAVEAAEKSVVFDPDDWKKWFNVACYKACAGLEFSEIKPILENSKTLAFKEAKQKVYFIESLETDTDFDSLRGVDEFRQFVGTISGEK